MKELIFINYPEITEISAKVLKKNFSNNQSQLILDRTIFMPKTDYLYKDMGTIGGHKVIEILEKNDKIIHIVQGKVQERLVDLNLNKKIREHNLAYNTCYILLRIILENFYNITNCKLKLNNNSAQMIVNDFYDDFDKDLVENFFNKIVKLGLEIKNKKESSEISVIGKIDNKGVTYSSTSMIYGIYIYRYNIVGNGLILEFVTGNDYKNLNEKNKEILHEIEEISTNEDDSNEKINKIIGLIQDNKFL